MNISTENSPIHHTRRIKIQLHELIEQLHENMGDISEPKAQALLVTTAEVLTGLVRALNGYEKNCEDAWRAEPPGFLQKEAEATQPHRG